MKFWLTILKIQLILRRLVKLMLTKKGNEIAISHQKRKMEIVKQILKLLSPKDQESLILILEKLSREIR